MAVFAVAKKTYELQNQAAGNAVFLVRRGLLELKSDQPGTAVFQVVKLPVDQSGS